MSKFDKSIAFRAEGDLEDVHYTVEAIGFRRIFNYDESKGSRTWANNWVYSLNTIDGQKKEMRRVFYREYGLLSTVEIHKVINLYIRHPSYKWTKLNSGQSVADRIGLIDLTTTPSERMVYDASAGYNMYGDIIDRMEQAAQRGAERIQTNNYTWFNPQQRPMTEADRRLLEINQHSHPEEWGRLMVETGRATRLRLEETIPTVQDQLSDFRRLGYFTANNEGNGQQ